MQLMNGPFDARQVEPSALPTPIPLADYKTIISASGPKMVKDSQTEWYLELTVQIVEGQFSGRTIPYRLNIGNASNQSVEIAYKQLSALCHVTGQFVIQDSVQLHNIAFVSTIGPQKTNPEYSEIKGVKDLNGNQPGKTGTPVASAVPSAPAAASPFAAQPAAAAPFAAAPVAAPNYGPPQPQYAQPAAAPAAPAWAPAAAPAAAPAPAPAAQPWSPGGTAAPSTPPWAAK